MSTGPIGGAAAAAAAAARRAALEAAKRAAEEARKKAAEEARKKAAEAARKKAAEAAKKKAAEAAKKAAEAAQKKAAQEIGKKDKPGEKDGFFGKLKDKLLETQVKKISPEQAKKDMTKIREDFKTAKDGKDIEKLRDRANELQGRVSVSDDKGFDKDLRGDIRQLRNKADATHKSYERLQDINSDLKSGTPTEKAAATAKLLSRPNEFNRTLKDLKGLEGSPAFDRVQNKVATIQQNATADSLAKQLDKQPDLSKYPPDFVNDLGRLRGLPHPELQKSLDKVAEKLITPSTSMSADHGTPSKVPTMDDVRQNPGIAKLVAPLQNSKDPEVRQQLKDTVETWGTQSLEANLEANNKPGNPKTNAENTFKSFQKDMEMLAKNGLGPVVEKTYKKSLENAAVDVLHNSDIKASDVQQNPAYGQLLSTLQDAKKYPEYQDQLKRKVEDWTKEMLDSSLEGKERQEGAEEGLKEFEAKLGSFAEQTGLGQTLKQVVDDKEFQDYTGNELQDTAEKGKKWYEKVGNFVGDVVGELGSTLGDAVAKVGANPANIIALPLNATADRLADGLRMVGADGLANGLDKFGDLTTNIADKLNPTTLLTKGAAFALDKAGADGAARFVEKTGEKWVEANKDFAEGFGAGVKGMFDTAKFFIQHPIAATKGIADMIKNPERIVEVGKQFWKEASKGGAAHAAGYIAANIAPAFLTGGSSIGVTAAGTAARFGLRATVKIGTTSLKVGGKFGRQAFRTADFFGLPGTQFAARFGGKATRIGRQGAQIAGAAGRFALKAASPAKDVLNVVGDVLPGGKSVKAFAEALDIGDKAAKKVVDPGAARVFKPRRTLDELKEKKGALSQKAKDAPVTARAAALERTVALTAIRANYSKLLKSAAAKGKGAIDALKDKALRREALSHIADAAGQLPAHIGSATRTAGHGLRQVPGHLRNPIGAGKAAIRRSKNLATKYKGKYAQVHRSLERYGIPQGVKLGIKGVQEGLEFLAKPGEFLLGKLGKFAEKAKGPGLHFVNEAKNQSNQIEYQQEQAKNDAKLEQKADNSLNQIEREAAFAGTFVPERPSF